MPVRLGESGQQPQGPKGFWEAYDISLSADRPIDLHTAEDKTVPTGSEI